jgi:predicted Zn-dependent protease
VLRYVAAAAVAVQACCAQSAPLLDILSAELQRNFRVLEEKADPPAYFISYSVVEQQSDLVAATLGALQTRASNHERILDVSVRVGSRKLDNYHPTRGEQIRFSVPTLLPLDNQPDEIRRRLWFQTDQTFRRAARRLINLKTSTQVNVAERDDSDDFSVETPANYAGAVDQWKPASNRWDERVRRWSAEFRKYPRILDSSVSVRLMNEQKYFVNTEGTRLRHGRGFARISILAQAKAEDGMDLFTAESFDAEAEDALPEEAAVRAAVHRTATQLRSLLSAPVVDPFVGPAILSGRAAAVFFHEIFGHRIEGHRQKDESDGQTFTASVGQPILPEFLSVVFDPTREQMAGVDLNGTYLYDDEGVKARPVPAVEAGILKTFLLSRSPISGFPNSNGHGRKQPGREVVARQSNLIVQSTKQVTDQELRKLLISEIKRQGKAYGFLFESVTGGFTTTSRAGLQAFKVIPIVVYRIYADGRPDELVRGVDIVGTPLASFAKILATGDQPQVFNGFCGAESGSVPVSAVSPALLVSEIEIQKRDKGMDRPPLLPPPPMASGGGD